MIVNIRGTNGAGKTYVVRQLLGAYSGCAVEYVPALREQGGFRAGYYRITARPSGRPLIVLGSYGGVATGGVDQYPSTLAVEEAVRHWHGAECDVLYEGLLISHLQARWMAVARDCVPHWFLYLEKSAEACIADTERRRTERGATATLNPKNLLDKYRATERCYTVMQESGLLVRKILPDQAAGVAWGLLEGSDYGRAFPNVEATTEWLTRVDARARVHSDAAAPGLLAPVDGGSDPRQLSLL